MENKITIITPVFNDWDCVEYLIQELNTTLAGKVIAVHLIAINDCSVELPSRVFETPRNMTYTQVDLVTNVGHQGAILIGLCYCLKQQTDSKYIIVMDSDGEDNPKFIKHLIDKIQSFSNDKIIFVSD